MPRSFQVLYKNGSWYIDDDLHAWDKAGGGGGGGGEGVRGSGSEVINQEYLYCTTIYSGLSETVVFCGSGWGWREDRVVGLAAIQEEERFQAVRKRNRHAATGNTLNFRRPIRPYSSFCGGTIFVRMYAGGMSDALTFENKITNWSANSAHYLGIINDSILLRGQIPNNTHAAAFA